MVDIPDLPDNVHDVGLWQQFTNMWPGLDYPGDDVARVMVDSGGWDPRPPRAPTNIPSSEHYSDFYAGAGAMATALGEAFGNDAGAPPGTSGYFAAAAAAAAYAEGYYSEREDGSFTAEEASQVAFTVAAGVAAGLIPMNFPLYIAIFARIGLGIFFTRVANEGWEEIWNYFDLRSTTPLVIDLSGDGIESISIEHSNVFFDLDLDGFAEHTGWVGPDEGILSIDRNSNGRIDNIGELFGNQNVNGFEELAEADGNNDGIIDQNDRIFVDLLVWKDVDQNGFANQGELFHLSELGIISINLKATEVSNVVNGNLISHVSSFTREDGTTDQIVDIWFKNDPSITIKDMESVQLDPMAFFLPSVRGHGEMADLVIAVSMDRGLFDLVAQLQNASLADGATFRESVETIIYRWAGTSDVAPDLPEAPFDRKKLATIEAFAGQPHHGDIRFEVVDALYDAWEALVSGIAARLIMQGPLLGLLPNIVYDPFRDAFVNIGEEQIDTSDVNAAIATLKMTAPANGFEAVAYWSTIIDVLDVVAGDLGVPSTAYTSAIVAELNALGISVTADQLRGYRPGSDGVDYIYGGDLNNIIDSKSGNDEIYDNYGNDVYLFDSGDGVDRILDHRGSDKVEFGDGIDPNGVDLSIQGHDLLINMRDSTDELRIEKQFFANNLGSRLYQIERFEFADGTIWSVGDIQRHVINDGATDGDDTILGFFSTDILDGGAGNDYLNGGNGSDFYLFGRGYGQDTIFDDATSIFTQEGDQIVLGAGVAPGDITLSRNGSDLTIEITDTGDRLIIEKQVFADNLGNRYYQIESIAFEDGTLWSVGDIQRKVLNDGATAGDDTIIGFFSTDILDGGAGNDYLDGQNGSDFYVFGRGYGQDTIFDNATSIFAQEGDQLVFNDDVTPDDLTLSHNGEDVFIAIDGTDDRLTIRKQVFADNLGNRHYEIESFAFADGTQWTVRQIQDQMIRPTDGDDTLLGFYSNDTLDGGAGNDYLNGGNNSDTYIFGRGYGHDTVYDDLTSIFGSDEDRILFRDDVAPEDVHLRRNGDDLIVEIIGTDDRLTIRKQFFANTLGSRFYEIEKLEFADGTQWGVVDIQNRLLIGGDGDDHLIGYHWNDVLDGGAGNDTLEGLDGSDTYIFGLGYGHDVIKESVDTILASSDDKLRFGPGITLDNIDISFNATDIVISVIGTDDSVRIVKTVNSRYHRVEVYEFEDVTLTQQELLQIGLEPGTDGNDTIHGTEGSDLMIGNKGNDVLHGIGGNDLYIFNLGDGQDRIEEWGGSDTIQFGPGITPEMIRIRREDHNDRDIRFLIDGTDDQIFIDNGFQHSEKQIEFLAFDDGTTWDTPAIRERILQSTDGNDRIAAFNHSNDTLIGGKGNDTLLGYSGNDVYIFNLGDGADRIDEAFGTDTIQFGPGITPDMITIRREDYKDRDVRVLIDGTSDQIFMDNYFLVSEKEVEIFAFDDGTVWERTAIRARMLEYTDGNDRIAAFDGSDDTLTGGKGSDTLLGYSGNDVYVINLGDGYCRIEDWLGTDTIRFGPGITPDMVDIRREGHSNNDVRIFVDGTNIQIFLKNFYLFSQSQIEYMEFEDVTLTYDEVLQLSLNPGLDPDDTIQGSEANDALTGGTGADLIEGFGGHDTLEGLAGNDTLIGGAGNDLLVGGEGSDSLDGGEGNNRLEGHAGDDTLQTGSGNDDLHGGEGNDTLNAGAGNDLLAGGSGVDHVHGGEGFDVAWLHFNTSTDNLTVTYSDLSDGRVSDGSIFTGIEIMQLIAGSGNDVIDVSATSGNRDWDPRPYSHQVNIFGNDLHGGAGDDWILDGAGNGHLYGQAGNDTLIGGAGHDLLVGGEGSDSLDGGEGNNRLEGHAGDDTLQTGPGNDDLHGGEGNDTLDAGAGNDLLAGGSGVDHVHGGEGFDVAWLHFNTSTDNLTVTYSDLSDGRVSDGSIFTGIEIMQLIAGSGNDVIDVSATSGNRDWDPRPYSHQVDIFGNDLYGGAGNDMILDGAGNGRLRGESGDNTLIGAAGHDSLWGGDGVDSLDGGDGNDRLWGRAGNDTLNGGAGNDELKGQEGDDTLDAGAGNDALTPGAGVDVVHGGEGFDVAWLDYSASTADLMVTYTDLTDGRISDGSVLTGIEIMQLIAGSGNDVIDVSATSGNRDWDPRPYSHQVNIFGNDLHGGAGDDWILDGAGNGHLYGQAGNDTLIGGAGHDFVVGGEGADSLDGGEGNNRLEGHAGDDTLQTGAGNDHLDGGEGNDTLNAGAGNDLLAGGPGVDHVHGGEGFDLAWVYYLTSTEDLTITYNDLADGRISDGSVLTGVEILQLKSGAGNDVIDVSATSGNRDWDPRPYSHQVNIFGNDLHGGAGDDWILDGAGNGHLYGQAGNDTLIGNAGADTLTGGTGSDVYQFRNVSELGDVVNDFEPGADGDVLDIATLLSETGYIGNDPVADGTVILTQAGGHVDVRLDIDRDGTSDRIALLKNVQVHHLVDDNIHKGLPLTPAPDPIAVDDSFTGPEDDTIAGNVIDNAGGTDTGRDGAVLNVEPADFVTAAGGSVSLSANGDFTYAPTAGFSGTDSFQYTLLDGLGGSATGTVSITVTAVDDPPLLTINSAAVDEDSSLPLTAAILSAIDPDTPPDLLLFTVTTAPATAILASDGAPLGVDSQFSMQDVADGRLTFTPDPDVHGAIDLALTLSDGVTTLPPQTLTIAVNSVNDAPLAADDVFTLVKDTPLTGDLLTDNGNGPDSDPEGDPLSVEAGLWPTAQGGTVDILGTGAFTYTPPQGFVGEDSFQYTLLDGNGDAASNVATVTVTVAPPPVDVTFDLTQMSSYSGSQDGSGEVTVSPDGNRIELVGNLWKKFPLVREITPNTVLEFDFRSDKEADINAIGLEKDNDWDHDPQAFQLYGTQTDAPVSTAHGAYGGAGWQHFTIPVGETISGPVNYLTLVNDHDVLSPNGHSAYQNVRIYERDPSVNQPPFAIDDEAVTLAGSNVEIDLLANDGDREGIIDAASVAIAQQPANGAVTLDPMTGAATYTPTGGFAGVDSFTYTVADDQGAISAPARVIVTVAEVPPPVDVTFDLAQMSSYSGSQDGSGEVTVSPDGNRIELVGNLWKKFPLVREITPNTVLEFDFRSDKEADINAIGLEIDNDWDHDPQAFQLYGTQTDAPVSTAHGTYGGSGWQHFTIPVGETISGPVNYLTLVNDHDVSWPTGHSAYQNVRVYERDLSVNQSPFAVDDEAVTLAGSFVEIDLLANDGDREGIIDAASVAIAQQPANGAVTLDPVTGAATYTPTDGFVGSDSFFYTVADDLGMVSALARVMVTVAEVPPEGSLIFDLATMTSYDSGQDQLGGVTLTPNGAGIELEGNLWKKVPLQYDVTPNTVLEFKFSSDSQGEIHGIGLDDTNSFTSGFKGFQLYGVDPNSLGTNYQPYSGSGVEHFQIPVGDYISGTVNYLTFINDHDVSHPTAHALFENIRIYEDDGSGQDGAIGTIPPTDPLIG